jgi:FtsH-binding integral membrane protein
VLLRALLSGQAGSAMSDAQAETILAWMRDNPPGRDSGPVLHRPDFLATFLVFLLVTGATFPPILPFLLVDPVPLAMRLSNAVAVGMLVVIGWRLDQEMQGGRPVMRWVIPVIGLLMVAATIALGG